MGNNPDSPDPEDLIVLYDVWLYDITTNRWTPGVPPAPNERSLPPVPRARYAHLSAVTADTLYIIGGQDINNVWLDDVCGFNLKARAWVSRRPYPRHCGTYRSVAVAPTLAVQFPDTDFHQSQLGMPGTRFQPDNVTSDVDNNGGNGFTDLDKFVHLPYSTTPPPNEPSDIYLYSNYNVSMPPTCLAPSVAHVYVVSSPTSSGNSRSFPLSLAEMSTLQSRTAPVI
jgi:hypothetical protein